MRLASTTPRQQPTTWARTYAAAAKVVIAPKKRSARVTTGLKAALTGPRARMSATSTAPVMTAFSSSCRPMSSGLSRWAAMPDPTTVAASSALPTSSANALRSTAVRGP